MRRMRRSLLGLTRREFAGIFSGRELVAACRSSRFRDVSAMNFSYWVTFYPGLDPGAFRER